jgi:hypothetical protein
MPGLTRRRRSTQEGYDWSQTDSYKKGGVIKKGKKKSKTHGGY